MLVYKNKCLKKGRSLIDWKRNSYCYGISKAISRWPRKILP